MMRYRIYGPIFTGDLEMRKCETLMEAKIKCLKLVINYNLSYGRVRKEADVRFGIGEVLFEMHYQLC